MQPVDLACPNHEVPMNSGVAKATYQKVSYRYPHYIVTKMSDLALCGGNYLQFQHLEGEGRRISEHLRPRVWYTMRPCHFNLKDISFG